MAERQPFQLNSHVLGNSPCTEPVQMLQQLSTIMDALGNPGPIEDPTSTDDSPCGEVIASAYVADVGGTPTVVYVDLDGVCQTIAPGSGSGVDIVLATVDPPGVSAAPGTFAATWVANIQGSEANTALTFDNVHQRAYLDGDMILGIKRSSDGNYVTVQDETGTFGGTTIDTGTTANTNYIIQFEITADKTSNDTVIAGVNLNGDTPVWLLDPTGQFVGKAAYDDGQSTPISYDGFRGYAVKSTSNYSGGVPGYLMLTMEGWQRLLVVSLTENVDSGDASAHADIENSYCTVPFGQRLPPQEDDSYHLTVYDPHDLFHTGKIGDKYIAAYRNTAATAEPVYDVIGKLQTNPFIRIKGLTVDPVTRSDSSFEIDTVEAVAGESPVTLPADVVTVYVPDGAKMDCPAGTEIFALWDETVGTDEVSHWNSGDGANWYWIARGRAGFDSNEEQVLFNDGSTEPDMQWKTLEDQEVITAITGLTATLASEEFIVTASCKKRSIKVLPNGAESSFTVSGTHPITECITPP